MTARNAASQCSAVGLSPMIRELLAQPGVALPDCLLADMERRFGTRFHDVRLHYGGTATGLLRQIGGLALTTGENIVLSDDLLEASPQVLRAILAHELTHVAQGRRGGDAESFSPQLLEPEDSPAEQEADRVARNLVADRPLGPIEQCHRGIALTRASVEVRKLITYGGNLYLDEAEERQVLNHLRRDPDFNATVQDLIATNDLDHLFFRINHKNLTELVQVLGGKLPNLVVNMVLRPSIRKFDFRMVSANPFPLGGGWAHMYDVSRDLQTNVKHLGLVMKAAPFNLAPYAGIPGKNNTSPFSGSGATGVNPSTLSVGPIDSINLYRGKGSTVRKFSNPLPGDLGAYLRGLSAKERRDQARLLMGLPISTVVPDSYIGWIPSREQVTRAAAKAHDLHPALVAAFLLAEQRDQSRNEDAKDFDAATSIMSANTSIGLGQIVVSTAKRSDLFADLLSTSFRKGLSHDAIAYLLSSDEFNIFGAARYIRAVANAGAGQAAGSLPNTLAAFPGISLADYAKNSSEWPDDNIKALGSEYTSKAWDDRLSRGWGMFVFEAYKDIVAAGVF